MKEQQRIDLRISGEDLERLHVARCGCVADDVDRIGMRPGRRQDAIETRNRGIGQGGQLGPAQADCIGREHAQAAAIGEDRDSLAGQGSSARQGLGCDKQIAGGGNPQCAGASECGVIHIVRSRERARMRSGGSCAIRRTARFDHDNRLVASRRARRRHEFAGMLDRFDIHQDRLRCRIRGEIVEHVAEVDIGRVAERHEMRETDLAGSRPIEQRGGERAGLGHECKIARQRRFMRKTGIESDMRRQQSHTLRAEDAQQVQVRCIQHGLRERASGTIDDTTEARRQNDGGLCAFGTQFSNEAGYRIRWRADHRKLRDDVQTAHIRVARLVSHAIMLRIDQTQRPAKSAVEQVSGDRRPHAAAAPGRADDRDRLGCEQMLEIPASQGRRYYNGGVSFMAPTRMSRWNLYLFGPLPGTRSTIRTGHLVERPGEVVRHGVDVGGAPAQENVGLPAQDLGAYLVVVRRDLAVAFVNPRVMA